jgi:BirA family transcriptional regulator, biotin operon repressor / biotin---[acetyl-CoA-carboxylase] ligase
VIGEPRLHEPECESTQQLLFDRIDELPDGAVATTDHQTAGRGRLGRAWDDVAGTSVLCSVLLRPPPERSAPELSLVAAAATAEAVEAETGLSTQIKWPNDVMLNRRKVAGILAERRGEAVVIGIGINVNQTREQLPTDTRTAAGSLRSLMGSEYETERVLASLLERLNVRYEAWRTGGLDAVFDEIGPRNFLFARTIRVGDVAGIGGSIQRDGRLEIVTSQAGHVLVESGEVEFER